jgi:Tfp pilus assembly protein PilV
LELDPKCGAVLVLARWKVDLLQRMGGVLRIAYVYDAGPTSSETEVAMNLVGVLMSLVFIAIGLGMLYYARSASAKAQQSLSWPQAEGAISHSAVLQQMQQTSSSNNAATYKADVTYRYKVQGRDYSSERITLADFSSSTGRAQGIVDRYPDGATVTVYYNPVNPNSVRSHHRQNDQDLAKYCAGAYSRKTRTSPPVSWMNPQRLTSTRLAQLVTPASAT